MDIQISLSGVEEAKKMLSVDQIRKVLYDTLNNTAQDTKAGLIDEMQRVFDRPTPFTLNALQTKLDKPNLSVSVGFKDFAGKGTSAGHYLQPQVYGGGRPMKRSETLLAHYYTPGGGIGKDQYGNIRGSQITQILSSLGRFPEVGYMANVTPRSRKRNAKPRNYFMVGPGNRGLHAGVWERTASGKVKPILIFIDPPSYHIRFKFFDVGARIFFNKVQARFNEALERIIRA